jgi:hypothetical protein
MRPEGEKSAFAADKRFCSSCQKSVHDFSSYSDEQLIEFFSKKKQSSTICGRVRTEQLDRALVFTKPVRTFSNKWLAGIFGLFTLVKTSNAQTNSKRDESGKSIPENLNIRNCRPILQADTSEKTEVILGGVPVTYGDVRSDTVYTNQELIKLDEIKVEALQIPLIDPQTTMGAMVYRTEGVVKKSFRLRAKFFFFKILHPKKYKEMLKKREEE